jgi:argininosuccinate synthase
VIAPWREWDLVSREKLLEYAEKHGIPVEMKKKTRLAVLDGRQPAAHLVRRTHARGSFTRAEESMWRWTVSPEKAPNRAQYVELDYRRGDIVAIDGKLLTPAKVLEQLNRLGGKHGIGRLDLVENRYVGMKSRGCYETPGGTIMLKAHRAIESITLDREVAHLKDDFMPRYASLIYNGYWWSPSANYCRR